MKKIYIVRHGQSKAQTGEQTGFDAGLSSLGRRQAVLLGDALSTVEFDYAYISVLARARETFEASSLQAGRIFFDVNLIEQMPAFAAAELQPYEQLPDYGILLNEQSFNRSFAERISSFYEQLLNAPDGNYLVVAHMGVVNALLKMLCNSDGIFCSDNCGCSLFVIDEDFNSRLCYFNRVAHLERNQLFSVSL